MKKKIIATLCAALMLSGVITGCSGSASSGSQAAASTGTSANTASGAEGKTTLNVLWWGSQTRHEMTTEMLEKFEELNPDIDVVMDYSDWDGYWTKLPAQVAGGQTPDVFQMDYAKLAEYVENGVTADLSSYIADGSLDMSNVEQNILDSGTVDGKVYAISTGTNAPVISMVMIPNRDDATASATYLKPAMFWCVGADSDVKDAAIRFINFFANNEACYDIVGIERAVPISSKMREYVAPTLDDVSEEVVEFIDYVSQPEMASPLMNPDPAAHSKVSDLLTQYSDQVRYGEITDLETAAQQFMDEANAILAAE